MYYFIREFKKRVFLYRMYSLFGKTFFSERLATISLCGEIGHKSQYKMYDLMLRRFNSKYRRTTLLIDSPGGYVNGANYIIDSIHNIHHNINAVNVGKCSSAAVDIYLACCWRLATRNSYFVVHHTKVCMKSVFKNGERIEKKILKVIEEYDKDLYNEIYEDGGVDLNKEQWTRVGKLLARYNQTFYNHIKGAINAVISDLERSDKIMERIIISLTRISKELLDEKIGGGDDWYISAEDALRLGICHKII